MERKRDCIVGDTPVKHVGSLRIVFTGSLLNSNIQDATSQAQTTQADSIPPREQQPDGMMHAPLQPPATPTTLAPRGVGGDGRHVLDAANLDAGAGERTQG